jgi:hypothetical protein
MSQRVTIQDFLPYLHSRFSIGHSETGDVELTAVTDHSCPGLEQFSLIFTGKASPWMPQGTYKVFHPEMPECELFLVPIGPDTEGMRYEAVFSRFIPVADAPLSGTGVTKG